jgi:small-conductance mechanosensitive channel
MKTQRQQTFKKTAPSFASSHFYRQFDSEPWQTAKNRAAAILTIRADFLQDQGWIFALQVLLALVLAGFILHHRAIADIAEEWQFIIRHPLATGVFVAVAVLGYLYDNPPALWRLFQWILAISSAAILTVSLLRNPRKVFMVCLLAFLATFSFGLQIISLPQPLYRLYLAILSLAGIPLLAVLSIINQRAKQGKLDGFTLALRLGVVVLGVAFVVQFAGFSKLASRLIDSSVYTVFLGLLAVMALRLGRGSIDYLHSLKTLHQYKFFRSHGRKIANHLKGLFKTFVAVYASLYFFEVWGIYDSLGQAWRGILNLGVTAGQTSLTLGNVLLVIMVLYLSILVSWLLRALLDIQVFPHRKIDRGVKDAFKKLLHYTLVLVGFLIAVSLAGLDLKAFAVVAGAFGIGIGFGLQNIVNNFISGLILLFERPVKVEDVVVIAGEWGTIKKIGLRSTVMETWDRAEIIVPNSQLISEAVTNWTLTSAVARVIVPVGVAYGSDLTLVLEILEEAAQQHPDVLNDPPPSPIFIGFGDSSLDFELRAWMSDVNKRLPVKSDLGQYIERRFREAGVQIPFPQRDLHLCSVDEKILARKRGKEEV